MKILLHMPDWGNRWQPYIKKELSRYDLTVTNTQEGGELGDLAEAADLLFSTWCNETAIFFTNYFSDKKIITYCRRYEVWQDYTKAIKWDALDAIIFVAEYYKQALKDIRGVEIPEEKQFIIPNGIRLADFPLRKAKAKTNKIAMVCTIKNVKNIPLACQILMALPEKYHIHQIGLAHHSQIAGEIMSYVHHLGLNPRFHMEDPINSKKVSRWLQDKDFLLCTSINEGNPNSVLEAMAMGIKPVIHDWPGATLQFPKGLVFRTVDEAVKLIEGKGYSPRLYREWVGARYALSNFKQLHKVIKLVMDGKKAEVLDNRQDPCEVCGEIVPFGEFDRSWLIDRDGNKVYFCSAYCFFDYSYIKGS